MEPKNEVLEDVFPFQTGDFQVPAINFLGILGSQAISMFSFLADMIRVCSVVFDIRGTGGSEDVKGAKGRKR